MRTVFFDVDTQLDFLYPAGALYVPGAEQVVGNLLRLNQHAGAHGIPLVSTTDAHGENDPEFQSWPHHCVAGCLGQRKPEGTVLKNPAVIPYQALDTKFPHAAQYILQKTVLDCFTNPNLPALLDVLNADRYVVYGVVTEICVRFAAFGLLQTGKPVEIVADAVRGLPGTAAEATLADFQRQGGTILSTASICG